MLLRPTREDLLALSGDDPYVRHGVPSPFTLEAFAVDGAVGVERRSVSPARRRHSIMVVPDRRVPDDDAAGAVRALLAGLRDEGHLARLGVTGVSVPAAHLSVLSAELPIGPGGDWEWMWSTGQPPAVPLEPRVVALDDVADADELRALSSGHSPTSEGEAGTGSSEAWAGIRLDVDGALVAAGALQRFTPTTPHLAGLVTHADHRGRGYGTAITAALTRLALQRAGVSTLGMYASNDTARRMYHALGYRTAHSWASRSLLRDTGCAG